MPVRARLISVNPRRGCSPVTKARCHFSDVAGVEEATDEVQELVEFLRDPKKFQKLCGRIPKGGVDGWPSRHCKTCWAGLASREKLRAVLLHQAAPISWRCSSASGPRASATCFGKK